jgi:hypothetical protein
LDPNLFSLGLIDRVNSAHCGNFLSDTTASQTKTRAIDDEVHPRLHCVGLVGSDQLNALIFLYTDGPAVVQRYDLRLPGRSWCPAIYPIEIKYLLFSLYINNKHTLGHCCS